MNRFSLQCECKMNCLSNPFKQLFVICICSNPFFTDQSSTDTLYLCMDNPPAPSETSKMNINLVSVPCATSNVVSSASSSSNLSSQPLHHHSSSLNSNPISSKSSWRTEPKNLLSHVRMEHLLAGVTGGVASTLILHPLDLVKIRFAVNDGLHSRPKYDGLYHAFRSILKDEGIKGLYR